MRYNATRVVAVDLRSSLHPRQEGEKVCENIEGDKIISTHILTVKKQEYKYSILLSKILY